MSSTILPIVWHRLCDTTLHVSLMIVAILLLRWLLGGKLSPAWRCGLWAMVLLRLAVPVSSPWRWPVAPEDATGSQMQTVMTVSNFDSPHATEPPNSDPAEIKATPAQHAVDWPALLVLAWAAGATLYLLIVSISQWRLHRWLRSLPTADGNMQQQVAAIAEELRLGLPSIVTIPAGTSPAVAGWFRPMLMLPRDLGNRLSPAQLRLVLLHELHHVRRHDVLWRWLATLALSLQWFNPLAWLARHSFCIDCEYAADAGALREAESSRSLYGRTLLAMAESVSPRWALPGVIGVLGPASVHRRIAAIVRPRRAASWAGVLAMLLAGCAAMQQRAATTQIADPGGLVTQGYDVRDLLVPTTDVDFAIAATTQPDDSTVGLSPKPDLPTAYITARQQLILAVQDGVDRQSWQIRGGRGSLEINLQSGQLVVTQTPDNQAAVGRVLASLRKEHAVQITIETRFLQGAHVSQLARQLLGTGGEMSAAGILDDQQVAWLAEEIHGHDGETMLTAPRLTAFSGQRAFVVVSTGQSYVADFKIDQGKPTTYTPIVKTVHSGVRLDCQATASADCQYVTLTLHPQLANLRKLKTQRIAGVAAHVANADKVQVPIIESTSIETTVSLPNGRSFVAVVQPTLAPADHEMSPPEPVVIIAKPTIVAGSRDRP